MTPYKLYYFNITGIGEPIRYLLHYGGIPFEDIRIAREDWHNYKSGMPMGQLPVLEVHGKKYDQSLSICHFIAKKGKLVGIDDLEELEIDGIVNNINDMRKELATSYFCDDSTLKEKMMEVAQEKMILCLQKFEDRVKKNNGSFINDKITWADVYYAGLCDFLSNMLGYDINRDHPNLRKMVERIRSTSSIKAYIASRPKTNL